MKAVEALRAELEEEEQALDGSVVSASEAAPVAESDGDTGTAAPSEGSPQAASADEGEALASNHSEDGFGPQQPAPPICEHSSAQLAIGHCTCCYNCSTPTAATVEHDSN